MKKLASIGITVFALGYAFTAVAEDQYAAIRDKLVTCVACHGESGASVNPQYPILAGQHLHYLYVQLKDMKSGLRQNPIMSPIAATLEKDEMLAMAQYFSEQSWPRIGFRAEADSAKLGARAAGAGQCVQCHLGGYEGNSRIPRLAGQYPEYLNQTMLDFKSKTRTNSAAKTSLMHSYSEAEIQAMADFMGEM